ncbi:hypothetical protein CONPUDRAFT_70707 [Coniophora puteana RWD-64-598 SS2]|uniref:Uncharacterized protein n=1 Tax=Coniophora puteana (strain RWD-64-598) TaxID=741705 RepID=A0A5M3MXD6_CONPW|nr:uncharacterized protein CONPUDRAFT_70707 [Coniophora puteana RWD-64-598 SS2]EIW83750.1 hypothetical protein CONPUDRAFT_70707 [Coniophora puteana RWD-64-598 SS2]
MKFATSLASLALLASSTLALTINTPPYAYTCFNTLVTWSGGESPYTLSVTKPDNVNEVYDTYTGLTGDSYEWGVNIAPSTVVKLVLQDSNGSEARSEAFTLSVKPGTAPPGSNFDGDCDNQRRYISKLLSCLWKQNYPSRMGFESYIMLSSMIKPIMEVVNVIIKFPNMFQTPLLPCRDVLKGQESFEVIEHVNRIYPMLSFVETAFDVDGVRQMAPAWYSISNDHYFRVDAR